MINEERIFIDTDIKIGATVSYQDKTIKRPLVLLIAGTGSMDRDGNSAALKTNIYKELSDMFVEMGYVCIRYDKRGCHESKAPLSTHTLNALVDDAANIIHYAKNLDYIDEEKIVVYGHSEGAMITTLLTKDESLDLRGIILLSGAAMSLKDAMVYQNYLLLEEVKDMKGILGWYLRKVLTKSKIDSQINGIFDKARKSKKDLLFYGGSIIPTEYIKQHEALTKEDYIEMLKSYKGEILALTGKSDVQANYKLLESISSLENITISTPDHVNHLLRDVDSESNIMNLKKEYKLSIKKPISTKIKASIKDWVNKL